MLINQLRLDVVVVAFVVAAMTLAMVVMVMVMITVTLKIRIMKYDLTFYLSKVLNIHYSYEAHCTKL